MKHLNPIRFASARFVTLLAFLLSAARLAPAAQTTHYVDHQRNGNGSSWASAYRTLQQALAVASSGDTILVADGTYRPAQPNGSRSVSFVLINGVVLRGGYAGHGASNPDARDIALYETILSGDLDNNDPQLDDNSYHVVKCTQVDASTVLDGFTIRAGYAEDGTGGGGMRNEGLAPSQRCSPTVIRCRFVENRSSTVGGAVHNDSYCDPGFLDCQFEGNASDQGGGAMYNIASSHPALVRCSWKQNSTGGAGGAIHSVNGCDPKITANVFLQNSADVTGGALWANGSCETKVSNCLFVGNEALRGGAIFDSGEPTWTSSTFVANSASQDGGGVYVHSAGAAEVSNCIFWGNDDAGGVDETAQIHLLGGAGLWIDYSIVQGWTGLLSTVPTECSGDDPLFVRLPALASGDEGDLRLAAASPAIDAGHGCFVPVIDVPMDLCDLDGDGDTLEPVPHDLGGDPRYVDAPAADTGVDCGTGAIIDLGAYEHGAACSAASATFRNAGSNPASLSATTPVLGSVLHVSVDLALARHTSARVYFYAGSALVPLRSGDVWLVDRLSTLRARSPILAGVATTWDMPIPADPALCGQVGTLQALHFTPLPGPISAAFRLSNAVDITVGL